MHGEVVLAVLHNGEAKLEQMPVLTVHLHRRVRLTNRRLGVKGSSVKMTHP